MLCLKRGRNNDIGEKTWWENGENSLLWTLLCYFVAWHLGPTVNCSQVYILTSPVSLSVSLYSIKFAVILSGKSQLPQRDRGCQKQKPSSPLHKQWGKCWKHGWRIHHEQFCISHLTKPIMHCGNPAILVLYLGHLCVNSVLTCLCIKVDGILRFIFQKGNRQFQHISICFPKRCNFFRFQITLILCIAGVKRLYYTDTGSVSISEIYQKFKHHETHLSSCLIMTLTPWLLTHVSLICKMCKSVMNSHLLTLQFQMLPPSHMITVTRNHLCLILCIFISQCLRFLFDHNLNRHRP